VSCRPRTAESPAPRMCVTSDTKTTWGRFSPLSRNGTIGAVPFVRKRSASEEDRATDVKRASIMHFVRGTTSLRLNRADRLATYFGVVLRPEQPPIHKPCRGKVDP